MAKVKAKGRKIGRNKDACDRYKNSNTRMRNKKARIAKHALRNPNDVNAESWLRANGAAG